jgi:hypothetical protein
VGFRLPETSKNNRRRRGDAEKLLIELFLSVVDSCPPKLRDYPLPMCNLYALYSYVVKIPAVSKFNNGKNVN